jgi:hypothetical protein
MKEAAAVFERDGYLVMPALLEESSLTRFYRYVCKAVESPRPGFADCLVPDAPFAYGDFITDGLMVRLQPRIEETARRRLFPTYSYCRVYRQGDQLPRHKDRPACEFSISLCLACDPSNPWPLWIEGPRGASSIIMKPGDAVLYRGVDCPHWRDVFEGEHQAHLFFHYVDQNGPYAQWKFDGRAELGDPPKL